jgi:hypothetical protein
MSSAHPSGGKNVFFWSNKSQPSVILRTMMEREGVLKYFHEICIDLAPNVPPQITETPALIVTGSFNYYVGSNAFKWFESIKQWSIKQKMSNMSNQYAQSFNLNNTSNTSSLLCFSNAEMKGSSDSFSYYQSDKDMKTSDPTKDDVTAPHEYFPVAAIGTENIITPPMEKDKIKEGTHARLLRARAKEREDQDTFIKNSIKEFASSITK